MKVNCFSIYEFSDPDTGEILYVGSTIEPVARERAHRCTKPRLRKAKFRIIRVIPENGPVDRIEHQIIAAYKKRGECLLNGTKGLGKDANTSHYGIHPQDRLFSLSKGMDWNSTKMLHALIDHWIETKGRPPKNAPEGKASVPAGS